MTETCEHPDPSWQGRLREWLYETLPRPRSSARFVETARAVPQPARILIFTKGHNPTFDYYFKSRLGGEDRIPFETHDIDGDADLGAIETQGLFVIVCRYLRRRHAAWMAAHRKQFSGVALFVDDDMAAVVAGPDGSLAYKLYVAYFGLWPLTRLKDLISQVWVSTAALQCSFARAGIDARVLPPRPVRADHGPAGGNGPYPLRIAYHATDVHRREHRFLVPIVEKVLSDHPDVVFEVLARGANRRKWQRSAIRPSQLRMLPLRSWPEYYAESRSHGADIVLVPLLGGQANAVRADTKRIDACRLGAAPVFSAGPVYERLRQPGEMHLVNAVDAWGAAIETLVADPARRCMAAAANRKAVERMAQEPPSDLAGYCRSGLEAEILT